LTTNPSDALSAARQERPKPTVVVEVEAAVDVVEAVVAADVSHAARRDTDRLSALQVEVVVVAEVEAEVAVVGVVTVAVDASSAARKATSRSTARPEEVVAVVVAAEVDAVVAVVEVDIKHSLGYSALFTLPYVNDLSAAISNQVHLLWVFDGLISLLCCDRAFYCVSPSFVTSSLSFPPLCLKLFLSLC
jgi:hypothetical protein